jgi:hypothetical protein
MEDTTVPAPVIGQPTRRPYEMPKLTIHGTVAEMTANPGNGPLPSGPDFADGG